VPACRGGRLAESPTALAPPPSHDGPAAERERITGVFTDIDDTLTTDGAITPDALQALGKLKAAGLQVIAITGRPIGVERAFCTQLAGRCHRRGKRRRGALRSTDRRPAGQRIG